MFGLFFSLIQFSISIVYPLHQSYKSIQSNVTKDITEWLIYWIVLAILINVQIFFNPILRFVPFIGFIKIYLMVWLVFPVLDKNDYKMYQGTNNSGNTGTNTNNKINGAIIIWDFYLIPLLLNFDSRFAEFINLNTSNLKRISVNLFNLIIDTWFNGNQSLKIFGSYDEDQDKEESFMGSVYVIFKDSKFLPSIPAVSKNATDETFSVPTNESNRNLTLLRSLLSIFPYNGIKSSSDIVSKELVSNTSISESPLQQQQQQQSSSDEFDVVDVSEIHENDSDGSVTSNGWFKWRASSVKTHQE